MRLLRVAIVLIALLGGLGQPAHAQSQLERVAQLAVEEAGGLAVDEAGLIYVSDQRGGSVFAFSQSGDQRDRLNVSAGPTGQISLRGLAFDRRSDLFVADAANDQAGRGRILKLSSRGRQNVVASGLTSPGALAFDSSGVLYVADGENGTVIWIGPDGASAPFVEDERLRPHSRRLPGASGLAFSPDGGVLYITNVADDRLLKLTVNADGSAGRLSVLVDGQTLRQQRRNSHLLDGPAGLVVDDHGNLLVAASIGNEIEAFSPDGRLIARLSTDTQGGVEAPSWLALSPSGRTLYVANAAGEGSASSLWRLPLSDLLED